MSAEDALRSSASFVLIEAAAGCGKTHVASDYAQMLAPGLPTGRRVLVLAHTNAAVEEFNARTRGFKSQVRVSTFDSLSLGLIKPYARELALPHPIRVGEGAGRVSPEVLSAKASELLQRCPSVATMMARLYPVIILDEHQDASPDQHEMAIALRRAGSKIRAFADPMQRIFIDEAVFPWNQVRRDADLIDVLTEPHRWRNDPALGAWIMDARARLESGQPIEIKPAPASVRVRLVAAPDIGFGAGQANHYAYPIQQMPDGSSALLTARKNHMVTLRRSSSNAAHFYEGSRLEHVYKAFDDIQAALGVPKRMALVLLNLIASTCTGLTTPYRTRIEESLLDDRVDLPRKHIVRPLLELLEPLYNAPTFQTVGKVCRGFLASTPTFLTLERPAAFRILSAIVQPDVDPYEQLQDSVMNYKSIARRPEFAVSTVHRAKGLQFDSVLVSNVSESHFPNNDAGRRLFYVAISRCQTSLTILLPNAGASAIVQA